MTVWGNDSFNKVSESKQGGDTGMKNEDTWLSTIMGCMHSIYTGAIYNNQNMQLLYSDSNVKLAIENQTTATRK